MPCALIAAQSTTLAIQPTKYSKLAAKSAERLQKIRKLDNLFD